MSQEIRIPDIGDAESVEVVEILVAPGDTVGPDDPVIVIESDKASMEVPAGLSGVIESITVAVGDQVVEGQVIALLQGVGAPAQEPVSAGPPDPKAERPETGAQPSPPVAPRAAPAAAETVREPTAAAASAPGVMHEIRVPDIGEADHVVVIEIGVAVGATVQADDLLVVIESDKASMEIPVGVAGRVVALHVKEGDEVSEGLLLATVETAADVAPDAPQAAVVAPTDKVAQTPAPADKVVQTPAPTGKVVETPTPAADGQAQVEPAPESTAPGLSEGAKQVYAGPAVRRLARELGVLLERVTGSGPRGRIVKDDVKSFVKSLVQAGLAAPPPTAVGGLPQIPQIDFSRFGPIEHMALSRIRARGAINLHRSWVNIPHVTQHDEVDVTDLESFRRGLKSEAEDRGVRLTPVAFLIKACCLVLAEFPTFNASLDAEARNFILKRYYHIGVAVDTEDGLVVPVIRDANRKGVWELAREVAELSEKARNRKLTPTDHQGGTFSVTSLGAIGGTGFTPIINAPEVAILGVARLTMRPQWNGKEFVAREMLPLSLSYDHRAVNGAEAGRFVARLAQLLGDVRRLAL